MNAVPASIVALDGRFAASERRGIGKGSLALFRSLVKVDASFTFDLLVDRRPPAGLIEPDNCWRWVSLRPSLFPIWEQLRLPMYVARRKPAIIHSVGNTAPVFLPRSIKTLHLLTVHDLLFFDRERLPSRRQRWGRYYRQIVVPRAIYRADWIIAVSEATRSAVIDRYPSVAARISVIGTPIGQSFFSVAPERRVAPVAGLVGSRPFLLAFGGSDPRKNVGRVVEAFSFARRVTGDLELVLVGAQGDYLRKFRSVPGVQALPYLEEAELLGLFASARALVYPSLNEGFGVPIVEAMALGVPVICSDKPPMRELAGGIARLVDPENVTEISDAMIGAVRDKPSASQVTEMRSRAYEFHPDRIAGQVANVYLRLLEEVGRHRG